MIEVLIKEILPDGSTVTTHYPKLVPRSFGCVSIEHRFDLDDDLRLRSSSKVHREPETFVTIKIEDLKMLFDEKLGYKCYTKHESPVKENAGAKEAKVD